MISVTAAPPPTDSRLIIEDRECHGCNGLGATGLKSNDVQVLPRYRRSEEWTLVETLS